MGLYAFFPFSLVTDNNQPTLTMGIYVGFSFSLVTDNNQPTPTTDHGNLRSPLVHLVTGNLHYRLPACSFGDRSTDHDLPTNITMTDPAIRSSDPPTQWQGITQ